MQRRPRIIPPVYLLAAILAMFALHRWFPIRQLVWGTWRWLGLVPVVIGLGLGFAAIRTFLKRRTTLRPGDTSTSLVTEGPFRFTRNPMYLGMALLLTGLAIGLGSLSPWLLLPLFIAMMSINIIPVEEAMLGEAFGEPYSDYRSRVRRWI